MHSLIISLDVISTRFNFSSFYIWLKLTPVLTDTIIPSSLTFISFNHLSFLSNVNGFIAVHVFYFLPIFISDLLSFQIRF